MNACLEESRIPDCMDIALMRLLPKSDKGLADPNAVRPIALMERDSPNHSDFNLK